MGRGWRCNHRWPRNHRACRRPARNRRRWRGLSHDLCCLSRQRNDTSRCCRCRSRRSRCDCWSRCSGRSRASLSRWRHNGRWPRRRTARLRLRLLALKDRLQSIARLRDMRQIELRLGFRGRPCWGTTAAPVLEIPAHFFGLIGLNGTGVRLALGHANRCQSVQNGPALDFQLSCEIVDSNFGHPSLCLSLCQHSPARSALHISLIRSRNL